MNRPPLDSAAGAAYAAAVKRRTSIVALALLPAGLARAADGGAAEDAGDAAAARDAPQPVLRGSWIAAAGPKQVLRGRWSAQALPGAPDEAQGSWTLDGEGGKTLLDGTWSARKAARGWQGTWAARVRQGDRIFAGTWQAAATGLDGAKTFTDMLARTAQAQISGTWRAGRARGNWWLKQP